MTRIALFEPFAGASGDMILGSLVAAGLEPAALLELLDGLGLPGWGLTWEPVMRQGIAATRALVTSSEDHPHRHLGDILEILASARLPGRVRAQSEQVFRRLAEAEARVHGVTPEEIHFHEVGAVDAIVDVVGSVAGLQLLGVERLYLTDFPAGRGTVRCRHGLMPNPAPATLELLAGWPQRQVAVEAELVTPTGAAILSTLATPGSVPVGYCLERFGYGAGSRDLEFPNVLRVGLGSLGRSGRWEAVELLEATIDDMTPELFGHVLQRLLDAGALDVVLYPVTMKKSRPGTVLSVLCRPESAQGLAELVLRETTSLGVRRLRADRWALARSSQVVHTVLGPVAVTVSVGPDGGRRCQPEYEQARRVAQERGVPLLRVYQEVVRASASGGESP